MVGEVKVRTAQPKILTSVWKESFQPDLFLSTAKTVNCNCNTTRGQNKKFCQLVQDWTGQDRTDHAERAAYLRVDQRHVDVVVPDQ